MNLIPVKVSQLFLSNVGFVVMLKSTEDDRSLPIFIGAAEAQAIAIQVNAVEMPRPLTHDLTKNILDLLECRLKRVEVCDLQSGTFYAKLILDRDGRETEMDSRPSDAIALALRFVAPIFVAGKVMDEAGRVLDQAESDAADGEKSTPQPEKRELTPLETLQNQLEEAVKEERYEDAARLRDEIKGLGHGKHAEN